MAGSGKSTAELNPPSPSRQIAFHQLLVAARKIWLVDALNEVLTTLDPKIIKSQTLEYAPSTALKVLAAANIRDEQVFPVPIVLEEKPTLIGYYRLLLGASQKSFYCSATGMAPFKSMELAGTVSERQRLRLPDFCKAMGGVLGDLVTQLSPSVTARDVNELRLLTLGSQFQGSNNVSIGKQATADVFLAVADLMGVHVEKRTEQLLHVRNSAGRLVTIALASDPDIRIEEQVGEQTQRKVAIEIKGGTDKSNAHNRAGEAEKSHQKARNLRFPECWTLIAMKGLNPEKLRQESPSTNHWFDVAQILAPSGNDWTEFRQRLAGIVGVPLE